MRQLLTAIFIFFYSTASAQFQGLIINEFSQGDQGSKEYIELLVLGKRTCNDSTADIRGWIVDDQNGWYGTSSLTQGHYRFKDVTNWATVPIGSIILLYNSAANGKNNSITLPDDPTDANKDLIYIVPINSNTFLEEHDNEPSNSTGSAYVYPAASSTTGYNGTSNTWPFHIALNNGSDVVSTVSPQNRNTHYFSIGYGYLIAAGFKIPSVAVTAVNGGNNCYLTDGNHKTAGSWAITAVPANETPGFPNGGANSSWIQDMRITPKPLVTYTTACSNGPYLFFNQTIASTGAYTVLTNNTNGCIDTNHLYVVIKNIDVIDTAGCDSLIYKGVKYISNATIVDNISSVLINCDSIVRTVHISIKKSSSSLTKACIGIGQSYVFNTTSFTASGSYTVSLTNSNGCDSIAKLFLVATTLQTDTLNSCGRVVYNGIAYPSSAIVYDTVKSIVMGCDSIIKKTIIQVNPVKSSFLSVCNDGDTYSFNGQVITTSGLYTANLTGTAGCDSVINLYIVFKKTTIQNFTGCDSAIYQGTIYYTSAVVRDSLKSIVSGCDSIIYITYIIVHPVKRTYVTACVAAGQTYSFNGQILSTTGYYTTAYTSSSCDSIVHLYLVAAQQQIINLQGCNAVVYNDSSYTSSTVLQNVIRSNVTSCDSIIQTVHIAVNSVTHHNITACIPEGGMYVFNGQSLTASGEFTTQYTTATCDSFVHLYLTVSSSQIQTIAGCDSILFNGQVYYNSIQLNDTIKSFISGCDSLYKIIILVINKKPAIYINQCLQQGQSYSFNGQLLTTSGHYVTTFARPGLCDSTVHLYLVVSAVQTEIISGCDAVINNGIIYSSSTTITDTVRSLVTNCDSIIHILTIQVNKKPVIEISKDRTICKGDTISLSATSTTGTINWAGVGLTNSIIVAPVATTTYTVMSTDGNGCTNTAGVTVFVEDFSLHLFTSPNPVLAGRPVTVQTSANAPYTIHEWQPASLFGNQNLKSQQFIADSSTNLFVTGGTTSGCKDTAYSWLLVTPLNDIYIPSGFTPNGDGKNDVVMVAGSGIATLDFKIFNRWGQLVFYTTDRTKGWDGRLAGTKQPADTYVYVVWLKKTNGQVVEKKGTIVLIK